MEPHSNPVIKEKMKKNLVYVGIFSVIMFFGGLTSAYIVLMGDSFWLKYPMPTFFWYSTATVGISSITYILAIRSAKQNKQVLLKSLMGVTTLLGALFIFFQFKGYGELIDKGLYFSSGTIMVVDGKYGDHFEFSLDGKKVSVDGNNYLLGGKKMSESELGLLKEFTSQFIVSNIREPMKLTVPNDRFEIYCDKKPLKIDNNILYNAAENKPLSPSENLHLKKLSENIREDRGHFFVKGKIGEDFDIYYKGEKLDYSKGRLIKNGKPLTSSQIEKSKSPDMASSFLYLITLAHLLHIAIAMIYLLKMSIYSFSGKFNSNNHLSLRTGAIFWHFLGLLWVYLLVFLIYIH